MKDWKERLYEVLYNNGKPFEINAIEEKRLEGFIETLLQEEREKVVEEIIQDIEKMKRNPPLEATEGMINGFHKIQEHLSEKGEKK